MKSICPSGKSGPSTIAAVATPQGAGGIGIVRLSGPSALDIAAAVFSPGERKKRDGAPAVFESHRVTYGHIVDEPHGNVIDEVLLTVMKAPRSYTREDVVEIHAHGGTVVLHAILELVTRHGAQLAEPGEFTRRAFINGRIDLTQAEGVIDLINARSRCAGQIAVKQIRGGVRTELERVRSALLGVISQIDAGIDFPEDLEQDVDLAQLQKAIGEGVFRPLERLIRNYGEAKFLRDGITALIVGRPNVGKSSLLNRLLDRERAIVTDIPGTTRDFILDRFHISGTAVNIIDTAGFQDTDDPIERLGIQKTGALVDDADIILLVVDASLPAWEEERRILESVRQKAVIVVQNKSDLVRGDSGVLPAGWEGYRTIRVSAKRGENIDALRSMIKKACTSGDGDCLDDEIVPNLRQAQLLERAIETCRQAAAGLEGGVSFDLIAIDLKESLTAVEDCLGLGARADILEEIFSRFCIGK